MKAHTGSGSSFMCCTKDGTVLLKRVKMNSNQKVMLDHINTLDVRQPSQPACISHPFLYITISNRTEENTAAVYGPALELLEYGKKKKRNCQTSCLFHFDPTAGHNLLINNNAGKETGTRWHTEPGHVRRPGRNAL